MPPVGSCGFFLGLNSGLENCRLKSCCLTMKCANTFHASWLSFLLFYILPQIRAFFCNTALVAALEVPLSEVALPMAIHATPLGQSDVPAQTVELLLVVTSASLVVTSALLVVTSASLLVTRSY